MISAAKGEKAHPLTSVKKFYFLEYFYVLLSSIERYPNTTQALEAFNRQKKERKLGLSKYRSLGQLEEAPGAFGQRFLFTFNEVFWEAFEYNLIEIDKRRNLYLTREGAQLLKEHRESGQAAFNRSLCRLMEARYGAFRYIIEVLYAANKHRPGLVVFPSYRPPQLGFPRQSIRFSADIVRYSRALVKRLQEDVRTYLGYEVNLATENRRLLQRLLFAGLIRQPYQTSRLDPSKYYVIAKRFRDHWITYFLQHLYKYPYSQSSFDIWTYRAKQVGIVNVTEFYPHFDGKIVYPTSVICKATDSPSFEPIISYPDGKALFAHEPTGEKEQNAFVDLLWKAYVQLKRYTRSYFVNLLALREIVCYEMKISEMRFQTLLESAYKLNLDGNLSVKISLEVDRLPEETQALYLKREPVLIGGKLKNIIAISREQQ